jgi:predicted site-specific integrase-resolvase
MDAILTPDDLAERYHGITTATLTDWRYKGKGPRFFRAGKRVFYRESAVAEWEASAEAEETAARQAS